MQTGDPALPFDGAHERHVALGRAHGGALVPFPVVMPRDVGRTTSPRSGVALVDSTEVPAALLDPGGRFVHWNAPFELLMGYRQEAPPPVWDQFVLPESPVESVARAEMALDTRTVFAGDLICRRRPDQPVWCDVTLMPVSAPTDVPLTGTIGPVMLVLVRESATRRLAEAALSGSDTQDRFLLDRIESGIVVHDVSTRILYANNKATELLGITYDRLLGVVSTTAPWDFFDELEQPLAAEDLPVARVIASGEPIKGQLVGVRRANDGRMMWGLCHAFPVRNSQGALSEIVVSFNDVTALKESERDLARSEERLALVFEATDDALWDFDLATNEAWCSPRFWAMFGYPSREQRASREEWLALIHPDDVALHLQGMGELISDGARTYELELRMRHRTGHDVLVHIRGLILRGMDGAPTRIIGAATDITARRAIDNRLRQSQKLESIGQLAGGVAHDFNNLLAIITGSLELLADGEATGDDAPQLIEEARTAAQRGAELTRRLLTFSRQQPLRLSIVNVTQVIASSTTMLRRLMPASMSIAVNAPDDLPAVRSDAGLLENALLNLAINARDAMGERGTLQLEADVVHAPDPALGDLPEGEYVRLRVTDTGCGMSRDVLERAIEPFFTTKAVGQGTGLGLSMVYGFVRQCGGTLIIRSQEARGTTVTLLFPAMAVRATRHAAGAPPIRRNTRAQREEVILVVEDDPSVRMLCLRELAALGFRTLSASDGPNALDIAAKSARIDLVLTDIVMPGGMNGSELATTLKTQRPDLKVVFMSGYHADVLADLIRDDAVNLLAKPFSMAELSELLEQLLPAHGTARG